MVNVTDIAGTTVNVGDKIAAAFRVGNTAELRTGTITSFGERDNRLTINAKWVTQYDFEAKKSGIYADLKRFVKIGVNDGE